MDIVDKLIKLPNNVRNYTHIVFTKYFLIGEDQGKTMVMAVYSWFVWNDHDI